MTTSTRRAPFKRPEKVDPDEPSMTFEDWCEAVGFDPVTRTYRQEDG